MNGWLVGMGAGMLTSTICGIGLRVDNQKKQDQRFNDMLDDLHDKFCDKYDLDSNKEDSSL